MTKRLLQFIQAENITQAQFADSIGVARAGISHILGGRNKPGYDFIVSMVKVYPNLNIEWLLTGKGKMYKTSSESIQPIVMRENEADLFSYEVDYEDVNKQNTEKKPVREEEVSDVTPDRKEIIVEKQRRNVKKIIVLFDDGSYQEL